MFTHPPSHVISVIFRKSYCTYFTENFCCTIYNIIDKMSMRVQQCVNFARYTRLLSIIIIICIIISVSPIVNIATISSSKKCERNYNRSYKNQDFLTFRIEVW